MQINPAAAAKIDVAPKPTVTQAPAQEAPTAPKAPEARSIPGLH